MTTLPTVQPMLATIGKPFDDDNYLFEVKWDGVRAITYVEHDGYRILSRPGNDITHRYPELGRLGSLPPGTVLDGEIIVPDATGQSHLFRVLPRVRAESEKSINGLTRSHPAVYVVFDQLYEGYRSLLRKPLQLRRETLLRTLRGYERERIVPNDGVVGRGEAYFQQITERGIEGMVAKRLGGRYTPGRRSQSWVKVKRRHQLMGVVFGYVLDGRDLDSVLLAADTGEGLRYVGAVSHGLTYKQRRELLRLFAATPSRTPLVPCRVRGAHWTSPRAYCLAEYLERTPSGGLRDAVIKTLIIE